MFTFQRNDVCSIEKIDLSPKIVQELEQSLLLYYTEISRDSENIINEQTLNINDSKSIEYDNLKQVKIICYSIYEAICKET